MWESIYNQTLVALPTSAGGRTPIPPVTIDLSAPQLIFNVTSEFARPTWYLALRLTVSTQILELPESPFVDVLQGVRIPLNQNFLVDVPVKQYQAKLTIPPWHQQLNIQIWQHHESPTDDRQILTASEGQTEFDLSFAPAQPESTELYINGIKATYGREYRIEGDRLLWLDEMPLDSTDEIEILDLL